MRHDLGAGELAHVGDAAYLGQSTATPDVGLNHTHLADRQPFTHLEAGGRGFGTADTDRAPLRQPRMTGEVVMLQRRLGEEDVCVRNAFQHEQCVMPVVPAIAEIDCHGDLVAEHFSTLPDQADQFAVGDEVVEQHLHLHRAEARRDGRVELPADLAHQVADAPPLRQAGKDGAVWPELLPPRAAHQLVSGNAELLAGKVVQRDVDRRDRVDAQSAAARPEGAVVEFLPDRGDFQRILADQDLAGVAAP